MIHEMLASTRRGADASYSTKTTGKGWIVAYFGLVLAIGWLIGFMTKCPRCKQSVGSWRGVVEPACCLSAVRPNLVGPWGRGKPKNFVLMAPRDGFEPPTNGLTVGSKIDSSMLLCVAIPL
jgi:hypothetical protein